MKTQEPREQQRSPDKLMGAEGTPTRLHPQFLSAMERTAHLKFWGKFTSEVST